MNCVLVYVYVKYINTAYFALAIRAQQAALKHRGLTPEQARQAMALTAALLTPVGLAVMLLVTGVVGGFALALIVSIFTQKSDGAARIA